MYDQKPTTSLIEDLDELGLLSEAEKAALKKAGGAKKPLAENTASSAPDPMASDAAHAEPDGDEAGSPPAPPAPGAGAPPAPPAPKTPPTPPKAPKSNDMMAAAPADDYASYDAAGAAPAPAPTDQVPDAMGDEDELAAYEDAWDCVRQYYALNERNEKLSEDDYKTVVNAMAFIIEAQGKYISEHEIDKNPSTLPGGDVGWQGDPENDPIDKVDGTGAMRKIKGFKYHLSSPKPGEKAESLDALVSELKSLTQKTESDDEMQVLGNKVIEGFEAVRDTAQECAERIAKELKESNEKITENHPRLKLGRFFEGVSGDAKMLLKAISERETTDVDDAIEDLNSLARDLKRGLAQF